MKIVYYYIVYLKALKNPDKIEIHCKPFNTKAAAEEYGLKVAKEYGNRIYYTKIKKVDLSKSEKGIWL